MPLPISDTGNPEVIKFLIENYEKTIRLRMKWNQTHETKLKKAATLGRAEKGNFDTDVLKAAMAAGMPTITRNHKDASGNRKLTPIRDAIFVPGVAHLRKGHSIPEVGLGSVEEDQRLGRPDSDLTPDPVMRVMDPKQREILFKEIPFFGREVYLRQRAKILPEKRYYMRETSGWECGWRLKDSVFGTSGPRLGRIWRLTRGTKSRTGPQPDPDFYKDPAIPGVKKCFS